MVRIGMGTETFSRINPVSFRFFNLIRKAQVQVILGNKFLQVLGANKLSLFSEGIFQVKIINSELIRHHYIGIVRHSSGNKMMTANGLQPPDFIFI